MCFEVQPHIWVENNQFRHKLITSFVKVTSYVISQHATQTETICKVTASEDYLEPSLASRARRQQTKSHCYVTVSVNIPLVVQ